MHNLNDMVIFAKVAELQGISSAARALRIPKSKVSRRMQALEDELDVRLLERSTRSVHLTEAGAIFYQHCKRVTEEAESARVSVNQLLEMPRGGLRISASVSTGQYLLSPHMAEFAARYPEVNIDLQLDNRRVDVIAEGYDIVVRIGELPNSNLMSKRLGTDHAMLFASPQYIADHGAPRQLSDLKNHRTLVMSDVPKPDRWTLNNGTEEETITVHPSGTTNDFFVLMQLICGHRGIGLLPAYLAKSAVAEGRLHHVQPNWKSPAFHYHALYPSQRGKTLKVQAWLDFFSEKIHT